MDSWKFFSEEFTFDGHGSCKDQVMGSEIKPFFNVENCPLVSNTQALERLDLMDLGFSNEIRKSYSLSSEPSEEVFSDEIGNDSYGNVDTPLCEEKEMGLRISTDFGQSNNQDLSFIDLKLGRLVDSGNAKNGEFSNVSVPSSSKVSCIPAKRSRSMTLHPLAPCCQVYGCNKDLSYCKGYYKRHKVCEAHTKTSKVVVDGIEQRFCQQCSRFHLLSEFDDGKRSCRRRLAAHNKRRRKPQMTSESGSRVIGFAPPFGFSQLFPGAVFDSGDEEMHNFVPDVKDNTIGIQRFSRIHHTSSALSLLSAQSHSHTMSSQLMGASVINPTIDKSEYTPELYSMAKGHGETTTTRHCDGNTTMELQLPGYGIPRGSYLRHDDIDATTNCHDPLGRGIVLDLLQLSSRLQRIEQQRHSSEGEAKCFSLP